MEWKGRRQSDQVEDRRGSSAGNGPLSNGGGLRIPIGGGGKGGGLGIGGIVVVLIICWITGINPLTLLSGGDTGFDPGSTPSTQQKGSTASNDDMTAFVRTVLAETEDTWSTIFKASGGTYEKPTLVLFSGQKRHSRGLT